MVDLKELLKLSIQRKASDLHLTENSPPVLRIDGRLMSTDYGPLTKDELKKSIYGILSDVQKEKFENEWELDFSLSLEGIDRFRVNIHIQRGSVEAAFRRIPLYIPSLNELGLPAAISEFARKPSGLVLITGPTGSGKTTTLASMINLINEERACMITCIEDPIEYVHRNKKAVIKQREVYSDTHSFAEALKRCLRQDPDVIVVGEMRDLETISTALTAAETGHLVLATLHTPDAAQTIERIIDVFPAHQQQQVRLQLSACIQGVVSQILIPRAGGEGLVLASEVLVATPAVRNLIREQAVEQIPTSIQTGLQYGMHTMDMSLKILYQEGLITYEEAFAQVRNVEEFQQLLGDFE
ncbi:MAG TPA: type IV pili twitching motility protein PilT [Candidatus Omnitrophica bacterium]|nr:MAG: type IV pili twitching motility protein PilT [Omnitrophica WOR_2 bacterium GWA2_45_18]OGX19663.1 MAG: type IV pili twitching motility protein PilT [Omnitrophica WOR_2 bacterium GWC2_45_7]HBR14666.1 type IV pili twitching motility protein PilT [Candidatus Omnitrophota bacterium]